MGRKIYSKLPSAPLVCCNVSEFDSWNHLPQSSAYPGWVVSITVVVKVISVVTRISHFVNQPLEMTAFTDAPVISFNYLFLLLFEQMVD